MSNQSKEVTVVVRSGDAIGFEGNLAARIASCHRAEYTSTLHIGPSCPDFVQDKHFCCRWTDAHESPNSGHRFVKVSRDLNVTPQSGSEPVWPLQGAGWPGAPPWPFESGFADRIRSRAPCTYWASLPRSNLKEFARIIECRFYMIDCPFELSPDSTIVPHWGPGAPEISLIGIHEGLRGTASNEAFTRHMAELVWRDHKLSGDPLSMCSRASTPAMPVPTTFVGLSDEPPSVAMAAQVKDAYKEFRAMARAKRAEEARTKAEAGLPKFSLPAMGGPAPSMCDDDVLPAPLETPRLPRSVIDHAGSATEGSCSSSVWVGGNPTAAAKGVLGRRTTEEVG